MSWLNYHHLLYFWTVARTGSIAAASRELFLSQPAISSQIKSLEGVLGTPLFIRSGRGLELTEAGRKAYLYADQIFRLGKELRESLTEGAPRSKLRVGVGQMTPKLLATRLLSPVLAGQADGTVVECREAPTDALLAMLDARELDLVISEDEQRSDRTGGGECEGLGRVDYALFAARGKWPRLEGVTESLEGVPIILPAAGTPVRTRLSAWVESQVWLASVVAECEDGALMVELAREGIGVIAAPAELAAHLREIYGLAMVTRPPGVHANLTLHVAPSARSNAAVAALLKVAQARAPEELPAQAEG